MTSRLSQAVLVAAGLLASTATAALAQSTETVAGQSQWYLGGSIEDEAPLLPHSMNPSNTWQSGSSLDAGFVGDYWVSGSVNFSDWAQAQNSHQIGDPASQSVLASGYLSTESLWGITPYLGAGVGASPVNNLLLSDNVDAQWSLAYQGVAGFSLAWAPMFTTGIEYRYFASTEELAIAPGMTSESAYKSHDVMLRIDLGF